MATACLIICIRNGFDFYQEMHRTQTFFSEITASRKLRHSLSTSRSIKQPFLNIFLAYLSRSVVFTGREIKVRRLMLCPLLTSISNKIKIKKQLFSCTYFESDVFVIAVKDPKLYCSKYGLSHPCMTPITT